jgi:hypothetical protein
MMGALRRKVSFREERSTEGRARIGTTHRKKWQHVAQNELSSDYA